MFPQFAPVFVLCKNVPLNTITLIIKHFKIWGVENCFWRLRTLENIVTSILGRFLVRIEVSISFK